MTQQITLPDVEKVLAGWLSGQMTQIRVCTDLPADLVGAVPLLQVLRATGAVSHRNQDHAFVDLNAFAIDDAGASALAIQAETLLLNTRNLTTTGAVVRNAASVVRPRRLSYANTNVRLYAASYSLRLHPVPAGA